MKYAILTIGKTHSGKTTFGRLIKSKRPSYTLLETDPIGEFLEDFAPELRNDTVHDGKFVKPALKYRIFLMMLDEAIELEKNIILTNSNMHIQGREELVEKLHKAGYETIFVYINPPQSVLEKRTKETTRSDKILQTVDTFFELLKLQNSERFKEPKGDEGDHFIECNDPEKVDAAVGQILKLTQ